MDINSAKIVNPWWEDARAIERDFHLTQIQGKPFYFPNPLRQELILQPDRSYILRGSRQVGKTTLLKQKIFEAIESKIHHPRNCLFLSCETFKDFQELREFLAQWISARNNARLLLCLDEITFIPKWQRAVLWLFNAGLLRNTTVLITGSNARDLKLSAERFPGRHVQEIKVYPVSLRQYSQIACFRKYSRQELLEIYLRVGGFPHAIRDFCQFGSVTDETYETYANWILGDAHRFDLNRELLTYLLFRIFDTTATQISWQRLIEKSPVKSHETAQSYVEHLEQAFLCRVLSCYDPAKGLSSVRKSKKIYFIDPLLYAVTGGYLMGLRNNYAWYTRKLENTEFKGRIFESMVIEQIARRQEPLYYWYSSRLKREVDILIKSGKETALYDVKLEPVPVKKVLGREVSVITVENFWAQKCDSADVGTKGSKAPLARARNLW